jgi:Xaa-Pro aminopeptidase
VDKPSHAVEDLSARLLRRFKKLLACTVGVELRDIPAAVLDALRTECTRFTFCDISREVTEIRTIKDDEEIQNIRECCELWGIGQDLAKKFVRPGTTELEAFAEVPRGMEGQEGGRLPILADFISGLRTSEIGGTPSARRIEPGDLVISDLVPRHKGY